MHKYITKYIQKAVDAKLCVQTDIIILALDAECYSNDKSHPFFNELKTVFDLININSLLCALPAEPYRSIIRYLSSNASEDYITPIDCETRTFFHNIPKVTELSATLIAKALSQRKSAVVNNSLIVSYGMVTVEQSYVAFSSTCFSLFVKYFYDALQNKKLGRALPEGFDEILRSAYSLYNIDLSQILLTFCNIKNDDVHFALVQTAKAMVKSSLVDSFFGNISCKRANTIYISQTGSSMDELLGYIDEVPIDGSATNALTASSELSSHKAIYEMTDYDLILHAHPRFAVILSMYCEHQGCDRNLCHKKCHIQRYICDMPIVSGEIGVGKTGILNTVPDAIKQYGIVIVYGHGIFAAGKGDFKDTFLKILEAERKCLQDYCKMIGKSNILNWLI